MNFLNSRWSIIWTVSKFKCTNKSINSPRDTQTDLTFLGRPQSTLPSQSSCWSHNLSFHSSVGGCCLSQIGFPSSDTTTLHEASNATGRTTKFQPRHRLCHRGLPLADSNSLSLLLSPGTRWRPAAAPTCKIISNWSAIIIKAAGGRYWTKTWWTHFQKP